MDEFFACCPFALLLVSSWVGHWLLSFRSFVLLSFYLFISTLTPIHPSNPCSQISPRAVPGPAAFRPMAVRSEHPPRLELGQNDDNVGVGLLVGLVDQPPPPLLLLPALTHVPSTACVMVRGWCCCNRRKAVAVLALLLWLCLNDCPFLRRQGFISG